MVNCQVCSFDLVPIYENEDEWLEGGKVKVTNYHEVFDGEVTSHEWISEITCPKCNSITKVEDADL